MPETEPNACYYLKADAVHRLRIREYGNEGAYPVVFLHGGPGSGCRSILCNLFDLNKFRVIAPDQRGAGGSTPRGCLERNNTRYLIADLELIRERLNIEKWLVVGGSWGALLAVTYAECHPDAVSALILRSLFLGSNGEIQRAFIDLPKVFRPQLYESFVSLLTADEREIPLQAYYTRILSNDPSISRPATCVWHDYERTLSVLQPSLADDRILPKNLLAAASYNRDPLPNTPRMEAHYFSNHCFLSPNQLLEQANRLCDIPGIVIQSRYDLLCPPSNAHALLCRWTNGSIVYVEQAGHSQSEKGVTEAMEEAVDTIYHKLR